MELPESLAMLISVVSYGARQSRAAGEALKSHDIPEGRLP